MYLTERTDDTIRDLLLTTSSSLQRCFGTEARPTDLDEHGNGILCVSICIPYYIQISLTIVGRPGFDRGSHQGWIE